MTFPIIWKNKINVPNHQPVLGYLRLSHMIWIKDCPAAWIQQVSRLICDLRGFILSLSSQWIGVAINTSERGRRMKWKLISYTSILPYRVLQSCSKDQYWDDGLYWVYPSVYRLPMVFLPNRMSTFTSNTTKHPTCGEGWWISWTRPSIPHAFTEPVFSTISNILSIHKKNIFARYPSAFPSTIPNIWKSLEIIIPLAGEGKTK